MIPDGLGKKPTLSMIPRCLRLKLILAFLVHCEPHEPQRKFFDNKMIIGVGYLFMSNEILLEKMLKL